MEFTYKLLSAHSKPPYRQDDAAGWDLFCDEEVSVSANTPVLVSTGIKMQHMSSGWVAFLKDKSGVAYKRGWQVHGGVIDCDYRGHIRVILTTPTDCTIKVGDAVAQMVFLKVPSDVAVTVSDVETPTARMNKGFGGVAQH